MRQYEPDEVVYVTQKDGTEVIRSIARGEDIPDGHVLVVDRNSAFPFGEFVPIDRVRRAHKKILSKERQ